MKYAPPKPSSGGTPLNGLSTFQMLLEKTCGKLEQKNADLNLSRLARLDSILGGIEHALSQTPDSIDKPLRDGGGCFEASVAAR
ncbi:MAG: hypothetical protein LBC27_05795 [Spirochaetaceae bacterium]|jgi:hypothetical protein|nr:hypothetical protein [Spirochaetaceae bacterium]